MNRHRMKVSKHASGLWMVQCPHRFCRPDLYWSHEAAIREAVVHFGLHNPDWWSR